MDLCLKSLCHFKAGQSAVSLLLFFGGTLNLFKAKIELGLDVTKANLLPGSPLTVHKALIPPHF